MDYLKVVSGLAGTVFGFLAVFIGLLWSYKEAKVDIPELQVGRLIISLAFLASCMSIALCAAVCDLPSANRYWFFPVPILGLYGMDWYATVKVVLSLLLILGLAASLKALYGFLLDIASFAEISLTRKSIVRALQDLFLWDFVVRAFKVLLLRDKE